MARRRMFAGAVVESGKFLDLPKTAQLLYFHLGMAADDDGFVEVKPVMRSSSLTKKDYTALLQAGYLVQINDGLLVWITNWNDNNLLQKDRYHESPYHGLLEILRKNDDVENNEECIQNVYTDGYKMYPQDSIGKDRLDYIQMHAHARARAREGSAAEPEQVEPPSDAGAGANAEEEIEKKEDEGFVPPTLSEVQEYVRKRGNKIDAVKYYETRKLAGWRNKRGRPITDWMHDVQTWEHYQQEPVKPQTEPEEKTGSFETDEFYEAAIARSRRLMESQQ